MDPVLVTSIFVMTVAMVLLMGMLGSSYRGRIARRMAGGVHAEMHEELPGDRLGAFATRLIPKLAIPLVPQDPAEQQRLSVRLIQAGYYGEHAPTLFLGIKMVLLGILFVLGFVIGFSVFSLSPTQALMPAALGGVIGLVGPNFWLARQKRNRQLAMKRALPDALDMIVVCIEGGVSLTAALQKVGRELMLAHPLLATELVMVNRATEMGQSTPEALRQLAGRFDLAELRFLRSLITESERFGTSVGKSLRVHADTLRQQRQQHAEESARKAVVKMLFPTILFIFPVIFIVVLAPSVIKIIEVLSQIEIAQPLP